MKNNKTEQLKNVLIVGKQNTKSKLVLMSQVHNAINVRSGENIILLN